MLTQLREQFAYNRWANLRLLDACEPLSRDDLVRELGGSFPSAIPTSSSPLVTRLEPARCR